MRDWSPEIESLLVFKENAERELSEFRQKFDTLESPLWKRAWFRIQRWPGQRDLNADAPGHLPEWLRRIVGQ